MRASARFYSTHCPAWSNPKNITTNLFDLVAAISDEVKVGEEGLIADTVLHIMETGRMRFAGQSNQSYKARGLLNCASLNGYI